MMKIIEQNKKAIDEINKGNECKAQCLLRKNVQRYPCSMTFNNIGVYYAQYGMRISTGKIKSASKLARRYLLKAASFEDDWRCLAAAASFLLDIPYEKANLLPAYNLFFRAYDLYKDPITAYNLGACLYMQEKYEDAIRIFDKLCTKETMQVIAMRQGDNPRIVLANCFWRLNDRNSCLRQLDLVEYQWEFDDRPSVFCLYVLCGRIEEAMSEFYEIVKEWKLTNVILAAMACCIQYYPQCAKDVETQLKEEDRDYWNRLNTDEHFRLQQMKCYLYGLPIIQMLGFITG